MSQEPIRLVCPDCDTVHRVKGVTLGKLYRCKKCKAGLITMTPAILTCPSCGKSTPPAHVEVSRLITCDSCAQSPLLQLSFPSPVRPMQEVQGKAEYVKEVGVEAHTSSGESDVFGFAESDENTDNTETNMNAPALPGQEDRAVSALKNVLQDVQQPLVEEIERTRRSIPTWLVMLLSLPFIALLGYFYSGMLDARRNEELAKKDIKEQADRMTEALKDLRKTFLLRERELKLRILQQDKDLKELQKYASIHSARAKEMEMRLRALGQDPDLTPRPAPKSKSSKK